MNGVYAWAVRGTTAIPAEGRPAGCGTVDRSRSIGHCADTKLGASWIGPSWMMNALSKLLIVPGLNGSGPDHWQSHWEALLPSAERVVQADWANPKRTPWVAALLAAVDRSPGSIVVAHSLGCALVANAVKQRPQLDIRAALLVSPSEVGWIAHIEDLLRDFAPMPLARFPFRTIVAGSENDPYVQLERRDSLQPSGALSL